MDVLTAAYNVVADYPGGALALAPQLGKSASSLSHELNRNYPTAKLGLHDAVKISVLTGDHRVLTAFAAECGCLVVPIASNAGGEAETLEALGQLAREFADVVATTGAAMADGRVTAAELDHMEREVGDLVAVAQRVLQLARARHEQGQLPGHVRGGEGRGA